MILPSRRRFLALCLPVCLGVTGCQAGPWNLERLLAAPVPPLSPVNYRGEARLPADLHRVAVLPVYGGTLAGPESTGVLDAVLLEALQRRMRFEVVAVSREDCRRLFGAPAYSSVAALPHGFLGKLAEHYGVDAVLFTDLTVYRPYGSVALGFRAKLATVRDVRLVWAFDEVFAAEDPRMRVSLREAAVDQADDRWRDPLPGMMRSPARFGAVAANLMFGTLPPR